MPTRIHENNISPMTILLSGDQCEIIFTRIQNLETWIGSVPKQLQQRESEVSLTTKE